MRFRQYALIVGTTALSFLSCHPQPPATVSVEEAPAEISIRVVNRNRIDVMVYVSHDGIRNRLGLATASTITDFTLPLRMLGAGHEYRLIGDLPGMRFVITTDSLLRQ